MKTLLSLSKTLFFLVCLLIGGGAVFAWWWAEGDEEQSALEATNKEITLSQQEKSQTAELAVPAEAKQTQTAIPTAEDGQKLLNQGNFLEGIRLLLAVLEKDPQNKLALEEIGLYYLEKGHDLEKAREYFKRLYEIDPKNKVAITELVYTLEQMGVPEESEKFLKEVLERDPTSTVVAQTLAQLLARQGRAEDAVKYLEIAVKNAEHSFEIEDLAYAYLESKDYIRANDLYKKVVDLKKKELAEFTEQEKERLRGSDLEGALEEYYYSLARTKLDWARAKLELRNCEDVADIVKETSKILKDDPLWKSFYIQYKSRCQ